MIRADIHTHSSFSHDSDTPIEAHIARARELGLTVLGTSDHFDYDFLAQRFFMQGVEVFSTSDPDAYFPAARKIQARTQGIRYLVGAEFGYRGEKVIRDAFFRIVETHAPDFIINSIHTINGEECYFSDFFVGREKHPTYAKYLALVRESLDAPYPYDIVGHIGYVARNAPYPDPKLRYEDHAEQLDDILKTIIAKDKILEVNTSARSAGSPFIPDTDILARYYEFGGRQISFGSDAHVAARVGDKRELVLGALKAIGFTHLTIPDKGKRIPVEL